MASLLLRLSAGCAVHPPTLARRAATKQDRTLYANEFNNGNTVNLLVGDILVVDLSTHNGAPQRGVWQAQSNPSPVLVNRATSAYSSNYFIFTAAAVGNEVVSYASLPGQRGAAAGTFNLRVNVVPGNELPARLSR